MTFIDKLKAHIGGLVLIKTELYWYDASRYGPDEDPGRICLLLDAIAVEDADAILDGEALVDPTTTTTDADADLTTTIVLTRFGYRTANATALLFIDGAPKWVWVYENAMEFIE